MVTNIRRKDYKHVDRSIVEEDEKVTAKLDVDGTEVTPLYNQGIRPEYENIYDGFLAKFFQSTALYSQFIFGHPSTTNIMDTVDDVRKHKVGTIWLCMDVSRFELWDEFDLVDRELQEPVALNETEAMEKGKIVCVVSSEIE